MALDFELYQDDTLKNIWAKIREVVTDIQYSSLFAEKKKKSQGKDYAFLFCAILSIPAIKNLFVGFNVVQEQSCVSWVVDAIYIICPIFVTISYPEFVARYLGLYEKDISDLLNLNGRLDIFKDKLFRIYSKAESCTSVAQLKNVIAEYEYVCLEHNADITAHDRLTGEIDHKTEKLAQEKAKCILEEIKMS